MIDNAIADLRAQLAEQVKINDDYACKIDELNDQLGNEDDLRHEIEDLSERLTEAEEAELVPSSATEMAQILNDWVRGATQSDISEFGDELNRLINPADRLRVFCVMDDGAPLQ